MTALIVIASILLGFYLIGCIRPHVIISMKKYMNIYVKVFFIKFRVSTSQKFDPPDEELDLPKKKKKPKKPKPKKPKEKKEKPKKDKKACLISLAKARKVCYTTRVCQRGTLCFPVFKRIQPWRL